VKCDEIAGLVNPCDCCIYAFTKNCKDGNYNDGEQE
jgi:hypothetical protein